MFGLFSFHTSPSNFMSCLNPKIENRSLEKESLRCYQCKDLIRAVENRSIDYDRQLVLT